MKSIYCKDVGNVSRFMDGLKLLRGRGAIEASWMLVESEPGNGKSNMLEWFSVQEDAAMVRTKAGWSVSWALKDIALALQLEPKHSAKATFDQIVSELVMRPRILIVDEINHAIKNLKVLETLRDITDMTQTMLIIGGHKGAKQTLKAHKQIYSRITYFVDFEPPSVEDIRALYNALAEVPISDCAILDIHNRAGGTYRSVKDLIPRIEAIGKKYKGAKVTAKMLASMSLTNDGHGRGTRL
ncbi:MAG: TniB family NTP-binding protein [Robiginitomaculum sp.]|nr:TniB family NTP-binding protein [Robiginitomaculum sp.]